ncbi:hypothetical protein HDV57DRAFT_466071 [Trichoderma longibrachiatum]
MQQRRSSGSQTRPSYHGAKKVEQRFGQSPPRNKTVRIIKPFRQQLQSARISCCIIIIIISSSSSSSSSSKRE